MGFENAEQFGLQFEGHFADFIEKKSSAVGFFKAPGAALGGSGKRALFMAEEFAFDQVLRKGGAVHGNEWAGGAIAFFVNKTGQDFLARSAFALDQYRNIGLGHAGCFMEEHLHFFGSRDDVIGQFHIFGRR